MARRALGMAVQATVDGREVAGRPGVGEEVTGPGWWGTPYGHGGIHLEAVCRGDRRGNAVVCSIGIRTVGCPGRAEARKHGCDSEPTC